MKDVLGRDVAEKEINIKIASYFGSESELKMLKAGKFDRFMERYKALLNDDPELKRRLTPYSTFCGGPLPYPGPGPYPPPNIALDPSGWSKARGYPKTILLGKELVTFKIKGVVTFTVRLAENGVFDVEVREGRDPILSVEMTPELFKKMVLGKERVIYALAHPDNVVSFKDGIAFSDWITIFEVIGILQELVESDPEMWRFIEEGL
ncbi:MAG: hypothetical protein QW701_01255 [Candidatus Nezhaarchaeales archaeon]